MPNGVSREYYLGPPYSRLRNQDLDLLHQIWLEVTSIALRWRAPLPCHRRCSSGAPLTRMQWPRAWMRYSKAWQELQKKNEDS
jgi:hypothetical protein